jgi:hypothetical protein
MRRLGVLVPNAYAPSFALFREELPRLGWIENENLTIDWRIANG